MSAEQEMNTFTIELPESVLARFAQTPEAFTKELRLAAAIEWSRAGRVSQGKGAEIAGMSRIDFLDALFRAKVSACQVTADEVIEEANRAAEANRERITPDPAGKGRTP
jgi:predicted HTH domain antitoxin